MEQITAYFQSTDPASIPDNVIRLIGEDWMLITAGSPDNFNTMTASWGGLGVLWNRPVSFCFIRPTRYTYHYAEESNFYTLSFFADSERNILNYCGSKSGRTVNKIKKTGLVPLLTENGAMGFRQSRLCIECMKIYCDDLKPGYFLLPDTDKKHYPGKDYHRMYIGEITNCYVR